MENITELDDIIVADMTGNPKICEGVLKNLCGMLRAGSRHAVLDFSCAETITSTAISRMMMARKLAEDKGRHLFLCRVCETIRASLGVIGLRDIFTIIADDRDAVIEMISRGQVILNSHVIEPEPLLSGKLDAFLANDIFEDVEAHNHHLLLCFSNIDIMSEESIGKMNELRELLRANNKRLILCNVNEVTEQIIGQSPYAGLFDIFPNKESAMRDIERWYYCLDDFGPDGE